MELAESSSGSIDWYDFEETFIGGESYNALLWFEANLGYYFTEGTKAVIEGEEAELIDNSSIPFYADNNPYVDRGKVCPFVSITADHDWSDWYTVKDPTEEEEGIEERACISDSAHKETRPIDKLYSVGIELDTDHIEWNAEEGYKGSTDDGIEEDAIHQVIKASSTGNDEVEFVVAGFKDMKSYEQFDVYAGGMEITVAPKEGLTEGTYTCVVIIGDWEERFEDIEVPVTFTVTAKKTEEVSYRNIEGAGSSWTKGSKDGLTFVFKRNINDEKTFDEFDGILVDEKDVDPNNYSVASGSVVIDLKPEYMETLAVGEHSLTAKFKDGNDVTVKFTINEKIAESEKTVESNKKSAPKTGDDSNMLLWMTMASVACITLIATRKAKRKMSAGE